MRRKVAAWNDDGLPFGYLTKAWSKLSGPGEMNSTRRSKKVRLSILSALAADLARADRVEAGSDTEQVPAVVGQQE